MAKTSASRTRPPTWRATRRRRPGRPASAATAPLVPGSRGCARATGSAARRAAPPRAPSPRAPRRGHPVEPQAHREVLLEGALHLEQRERTRAVPGAASTAACPATPPWATPGTGRMKRGVADLCVRPARTLVHTMTPSPTASASRYAASGGMPPCRSVSTASSKARRASSSATRPRRRRGSCRSARSRWRGRRASPRACPTRRPRWRSG